ncbi:MAG: hypothetical protein D6828_04600, partial [Nitrospirae bacterium]
DNYNSQNVFKELVTLTKEAKMSIVIDKRKDPFYQEGLKDGLKEGIEKGIEKGLKEGIEKGLILEAQELVIEALEERFGKVPDEVKERIKSINDRAVLKSLHRLAIRTKSLEEFREELEK